jgi:hypothetical protein
LSGLGSQLKLFSHKPFDVATAVNGVLKADGIGAGNTEDELL